MRLRVTTAIGGALLRNECNIDDTTTTVAIAIATVNIGDTSNISITINNIATICHDPSRPHTSADDAQQQYNDTDNNDDCFRWTTTININDNEQQCE